MMRKSSKNSRKKTTTKKLAKKKVIKKKTAPKKVTKKVASSQSTPKKQFTEAHAKNILSALSNVLAGIQTLITKVEKLGDAFVDSPTAVNTTAAVETQAADAALFDPTATQEQATPINGASAVTKEEVTQVLQEVGAKWGMNKVKEILTQHNAKKISDIQETDYPSFMSACKNIEQDQTAL